MPGKNKTGYTLAEILIGLVILGVGLVAVAGVYPFALAHIRIMGERVFVLQQAQSKMETLKSMDYPLLMEIVTGGGVLVEEKLYDVSGKSFDNYSFRAALTQPDTGKSLIHIKIEIYWTENNPYGKNMTNRSYILEGYKTNMAE